MQRATTTWAAGSVHRLGCQLVVPKGAVLRIGAGARVVASAGVGIVVEGHLVVAGTAAAPVRLTAVPGVRWAGLSSTGDGSLDVVHAVIRGARIGVHAAPTVVHPSGHTRVIDSVFRNDGVGVFVRSTLDSAYTLKVVVAGSDFGGLRRGVWIRGAMDPRLVGNSFHEISGAPLSVVFTTVAFDLIRANLGHDNASNVLLLSTVGTSVDGTLVGGPSSPPTPGDGSRPLMPVMQHQVEVDSGATLTIGSGVVKMSGWTLYAPGGSLHVEGTAAKPAILTSINDSTVGDPVPGATTPARGDWGGITVSDGSVSFEHAELRYDTGLFAYGSGVTVADSAFVHTDWFSAYTAPVSIVRSDFRDLTNGIDASDTSHPVVQDNTFEHATSRAVWITDSTVDLDDLAGNTASDPAAPPLVLGQHVTVDVDGSMPMGALSPGPSSPLVPEIEAPFTIASGASVEIGSGELRVDGYSQVDVHGTLAVTGSADAPAVIAPVPGAGPWQGIAVASDGHLSVTDAVLTGASRALTLGAGATADLHHVEFANDAEAVHVSGTSGCGAPYGTTAVTGDDVWFGATGGPGGLSALASVTDPGSGDTSYDQAKAAYDDAVSRYGGLDNSVADDAIPFADWACSDYSFPVTPVQVGIAPSPPFPDYAEVTSQ